MEAKKETTQSVRIKSGTLRKVKIHVAENGGTVMDYVSLVLDKELKRVEKQKFKKSGNPF